MTLGSTRDLLTGCQSVLKCFTSPTRCAQGGFVIVRHVNQAGWRGGKELLGESYGEENLRALSLLCGFIGHRCSVSAPVDGCFFQQPSFLFHLRLNAQHCKYSDTNTISPVFSCKTNFEHFKPQTNKYTNLLC